MKDYEINFLLKKNKSSQKDIAADLLLSQNTVNNVIHGRTKSTRVAKKIAETVDKPLEEVFPEYGAVA